MEGSIYGKESKGACMGKEGEGDRALYACTRKTWKRARRRGRETYLVLFEIYLKNAFIYFI